MPACTAAALALREITDPIDCDVLEGTLGWAFASLDGSDWEAHMTLFCPLGFRVLLQSGLLEAVAGVSLRFAQQAELFECGPNLQRWFRAVLGKLMLRMYKRAAEEEEGTTEIAEEVLGCWELLVKKGGDADWYHVTFIKEECSRAVRDTITDFGIEHGICLQALKSYVIGSLHWSFIARNELGSWSYYPSEDNKDEEDESNDEDEESS
jgi:hypothetical protein